jgi:hypothetical protein
MICSHSSPLLFHSQEPNNYGRSCCLAPENTFPSCQYKANTVGERPTTLAVCGSLRDIFHGLYFVLKHPGGWAFGPVYYLSKVSALMDADFSMIEGLDEKCQYLHPYHAIRPWNPSLTLVKQCQTSHKSELAAPKKQQAR